MNKIFYLLLLSSLLYSCTRIYDEGASPGRIMRGNLDSGISAIEKTCKGLGESVCSKDSLEIIAHEAGSYRFYPMDIHEKGFMRGNNWSESCKAQAKDVNTLMDSAFASGFISSVEIDIQAPDQNHPLCSEPNGCLFILHNKPDWSKIESVNHPKAAADYLQRNTLRSVLKHFISENYYKDKKLYLELKTSFGCNAPERNSRKCSQLGKRVAREVADHITKVHSESNDNDSNWLTVVSFSATALASFHDQMPEKLRGKVDYALIAGVHPFSLKWFFGQLKGSVPLFTQELQNFAITKPWLNTIWFSPQGISKFSNLFKKLNKKRAEMCESETGKCDPLEFSVAAYPYEEEKFYKKMTRMVPSFDQRLVSVMIDIDDLAICKD